MHGDAKYVSNFNCVLKAANAGLCPEKYNCYCIKNGSHNDQVKDYKQFSSIYIFLFEFVRNVVRTKLYIF